MADGNISRVSWPADKVVRKAVSALIPYEKNARTHSDEQVAQIAHSIEQFGFTMPVLVDPSGELIAGHGRVLAAAKLGLDTVPAMVARGWTAAQIKAYRLADNKLALNAAWDFGLLEAELGELEEAGFDLALTGFDEGELASLRKPEEPAPPEAFAEYDEDIPTEHKCPKCGFVWSGKSG